MQGRVMIVQDIGAKKAGVFLCREDARVKGVGGTNSLHALYDWGATVTPVQSSWKCSRAFRRARGRGAPSWLRARRGPTTLVLGTSGAQVYLIWPLHIWLMRWGIT